MVGGGKRPNRGRTSGRKLARSARLRTRGCCGTGTAGTVTFFLSLSCKNFCSFSRQSALINWSRRRDWWLSRRFQLRGETKTKKYFVWNDANLFLQYHCSWLEKFLPRFDAEFYMLQEYFLKIFKLSFTYVFTFFQLFRRIFLYQHCFLLRISQ